MLPVSPNRPLTTTEKLQKNVPVDRMRGAFFAGAIAAAAASVLAATLILLTQSGKAPANHFQESGPGVALTLGMRDHAVFGYASAALTACDVKRGPRWLPFEDALERSPAGVVPADLSSGFAAFGDQLSSLGAERACEEAHRRLANSGLLERGASVTHALDR